MNKPVHLSEDVLEALSVTAAWAGGVPTEDLIAAAIWAFSEQGECVRSVIVREAWLEGLFKYRARKVKPTLWEKVRELGGHLSAAVRQWFTQQGPGWRLLEGASAGGHSALVLRLPAPGSRADGAGVFGPE